MVCYTERMNQDVKSIFEQAQSLSADDREALAELLLATVDAGSEFDEAWSAEAAHRWSEHVQSGAATIDPLQAIDEVRAALRYPAKP